MYYLLMLLVCLMGHDLANAQFSGGAGTKYNPYLISDVDQLQQIRNHKGEGGYTAFRCPALVVSKEGTLIAVAEGRFATWRDDFAEDDIVVKRSEDGGKTWGPLIVAAADGINTLKDAVPVVLPSGRILLVYNWNEPVAEPDRKKRKIFLIHSDDDGMTWSVPREITSMVYRDHWNWYGTGPGHGIVLEKEPYKGRVIIPAMHNPTGSKATSHILYSDNDGETWHIGAITPGERRGESTAVELSNGHVMLNSRDHTENAYRFVAISADGGESFYSSYHDTTLIEPAAMGSILKHSYNDSTGKYNILFSNPHSTEVGVRVCGTIKLSEDDGATWSWMYNYSGPYPEFSGYSDIAVINDQGDIGVLREIGPHYHNPIRWDGIIFQVVKFDDISIPIDEPDYCMRDHDPGDMDFSNHLFVFDARDGYYLQIADIDASETKTWNNGKGFEPIGIADDVFTGVYDGNGFAIRNLTINRPSESDVGLFGVAGGRQIKNVVLENADIRGGNYTAGVAGSLLVGDITGVHVSGKIQGERRVGSIAGQSHIGFIQQSHGDAEVTGTRDVGGLVGENQEGGVIVASSATGHVTTHVRTGHDVGGLVGANRNGIIHASFAAANVAGMGERTGGLVGQNMGETSLIDNSYALGSVQGMEMVGGLVGRNRIEAKVLTSFSANPVSGTSDTAGLVGTNQVSNGVTDSYWDIEISGYNLGATSITQGTTGLSTIQMRGVNARTYMSGFDFIDTWQLTPTHPVLYWQDINDFTQVPQADQQAIRFHLFQDASGLSDGLVSIEFHLDVPACLRMDVFNTKGQLVAVFADQYLQEGTYMETFNGYHFAAGVYLLRLQVNDDTISRRFLVVR